MSEAVRASRCAGVVATACTQGKRTQHGKPQGVVRDDQPDAREGQAGRPGVAERFVVPLKPGNAGGGKGPQFKTDAIRSEGPGDWVTYQLRKVFRNFRRRCTRKRRQKPSIVSTPCTTRSAARTSADSCKQMHLLSHCILPSRVKTERVCDSERASLMNPKTAATAEPGCEVRIHHEALTSSIRGRHTGQAPRKRRCSRRKPSSVRCSAQSTGIRGVNRINPLAVSCGGCRPWTMAVVMSGASHGRRRRT